jgi:photosystem II stability/assembly factor-like uncharacterized protein
MPMQRKSLSLAAVVFLSGVLAVGCGPTQQGLAGYNLQEILLVPVTGGSVSSQTTLLQGTHYKLRARGSAIVRVPGIFGAIYPFGDAEYAFGRTGFPFFFTSIDHCFEPFTGVDVGLAINQPQSGNDKQPSWGGYNSAHVYTIDFVGLGAPINLNYHDCTYAGSRGVVTVEIFRPMGMNLATSVPPSLTDVSPGIDTFPWSGGHSISGRMHALALTSDALRLYAGSYAGVWRSDDAGVSWMQMTRPQPGQGVNAVPGALLVPDVHDVVVSPVNRDLVMAATTADSRAQMQNGVYRSVDGGSNWSLVKRFTCSSGGAVGQIAFAPDDPNLVYAAGGCAVAISHNAGQTWSETPLPNQTAAWHIAVGPSEPLINAPPRALASGVINPFEIRRVYALGSTQLYYSTNGGQGFVKDGGLSTIPTSGIGGLAAENSASSSRVVMIEPGGDNRHVLVAVNGLANGPSFYEKHQCGLAASDQEIPDGTQCNTDGRGCGEGTVWLGDFTNFNTSDPAHQSATWTQLAGPPAYWGGSTDSGNVYIETRPEGKSYLLFFSDRSHVHVSAGRPTTGGWHRMEGKDASQTAPPNPYCNQLFVHVDPHALVTSPNFSLSLQPPAADIPPPFNQNKVAGPNSSGDIWIANDGGIYHANGAVPNWSLAAGLPTLAPINIAGLSIPGRAPALYMGTGDNDDFFSLDGGATWGDPISGCGDCDPWFSDPAQPHLVISFTGRETGGGFAVYTNPAGFPNAARNPGDGSQRARWVCPTDCNAVSNFSIRGYRPMILTEPRDTAPADGDYIIIGTKQNAARAVFRKTNSVVMTTAQDWEDSAKASQYGPDLPACPGNAHCIDVVQGSGGHSAPVVYAGDPGVGPNDGRIHALTLWKWAPGMANWQQIVPSPTGTPPAKSAIIATRFFADPYNPRVVYIIDQTAIKRSDDGGATWNVDISLDTVATENHTFSNTGGFTVIKDMVFARGDPGTHFAVGNAGVFYTLNGNNWFRYLSTSAFPSHPVSAYFDPVSDPCDRALYVALDGRGIIRLDPIPPPGIIVAQPCGGVVATQ